ncbi:hypothetical protein M9H77_37289 [Catharanthus roseus]|uniref:Uncharacterized protein n=1 Tax=Catharanthus roseus TaxID=4058 RepID=A0ACB9ZW38_CATRO|nr:hypothetical protein M9H77_37289 [Catharanthus roseus]
MVGKLSLSIKCNSSAIKVTTYQSVERSLDEAKLAIDEVKPTMLVTDTTYNHWHLMFQADVKWHISMDDLVRCNIPIDARLVWTHDNAAIICFTSDKVGLPDTRLTEMVVACIQLKENWQWVDVGSTNLINQKEHCLDGAMIQQFCKEKNLTRYKFMCFIVSGSSASLSSH